MAANPNFAATPRIGVANAATSALRDNTATTATILSAGASGTRIERVVVKAETDPADSVVLLWLHDGIAIHLFDEFDLGNPAAASTTIEGYRNDRPYRDLVLPSAWSIRASVTVAPTTGLIKVFALGADL